MLEVLAILVEVLVVGVVSFTIHYNDIIAGLGEHQVGKVEPSPLHYNKEWFNVVRGSI